MPAQTVPEPPPADQRSQPDEHLLTSSEVAALFRVGQSSVNRWAVTGRISSLRTPGGRYRFRESEVRALLAGGDEQ